MNEGFASFRNELRIADIFRHFDAQISDGRGKKVISTLLCAENNAHFERSNVEVISQPNR